MNRPVRAAVLLVLALGAAAAGCSQPGPVDSGEAARAAGRAELAGTVLDAATGAPVAGARVEVPGGASARSDEAGRFLVRDLDPGLAGEVTARDGEGRSARVELRPLRPGRLEVVLHLAR